jgi:exopolysaccharide/PEP-CTERM locus tyrosine autokinase
MSSIIQQAARRLEELRRAGIEVPGGKSFGDSRFGTFDDGLDEPEPPRPRFVRHARELREARDEAAAPAEAIESPVQVLSEATDVVVVEPPFSPRARHVDIDLARLSAMGYLVPSQAQTLLADLLRVIKRPLLQNIRRPYEAGGPARRGNVIAITSAVPGEGKTFVATNLAMSIAMEVDHAALLVDGDVLRPSVFNRLDLEPQSGLMDLLVNPRIGSGELIVQTNVPKLALLSAGTAQDRAEELLASAAMDRLLDDLSARFHDRVIIIDSPPLLVTTESRALAERAGQVVLVVEADKTPREQVSRAFETLSNCPIVMSVLNKSRAIESDYVYGY